MPRARKFNKRIDIWTTTPVSDGFGGNTIESSFYKTVWAELKTPKGKFYSNDDFGTIDLANTVDVIIRNDGNIPNYKINFIKYLGVEYTITENSVNVDFKNNYIRFTMLKQNDYINSLGSASFTYNMDFEL